MATPIKTTDAASPVAAPAAAEAPKGPRSYLVTMLLAVFATPTGLARAYRGEKNGWTRFWIFVGATVLSIIPFINILAGLALLALYVWGAVDVFQLYKSRTDAEGGALVTNPRDEKWARGFYIYFLVVLILTGVGLLLGILFGAFIVSMLMNAQGNPNFQNGLDGAESRWLEEYNSQYR